MKALSLICVTKNDISGLFRTLNSVALIDLAYRPILEVVIVDGSEKCIDFDKIKKLLGDISVNYIYGADRSLYHAMNIGISHSSGRFVWMLNGGDESLIDIDQCHFFEKLDATKSRNKCYLFNVKSSNGTLCARDIKGMMYMHQGFIYPKYFHEELGPYVEWKKFTASDFLFMKQALSSSKFECELDDMVIAKMDKAGISSDLNHFYCKGYAIAIEDRLTPYTVLLNSIKLYLMFYIKKYAVTILGNKNANKLKKILGIVKFANRR